MTYTEKSTQVVLESQIAVMVLSNDDYTDIVFWRCCPQPADKNELTTKEEFVTRKLHPRGVVGLRGVMVVCAFKDTLETHVVSTITSGFLEYIRASLRDTIEASEGAELERIFMLPDTRMN
jgi:hypothetical protein